MVSEEIRVVELFAGVGGFRLGLETASARFRTVYANQWEPSTKAQHSAAIYRSHWDPDENDYVFSNIDIFKDLKNVPSHDLLVGGFPCQDYSVAKTSAAGIKGKKGVLWWSIYEILKTHNPKRVLLENVDRLLKSPSNQRGRDFGVILYCLNSLGYAVSWKVINPAEYGMQQKRRRIFIFASKEERETHEVFNGFPSVPVDNNCGRALISEYKDLAEVSDRFAFAFESFGTVSHAGLIETYRTVPAAVQEPVMLRQLLEEVSDLQSSHYIKNDERWVYLKGSKRIPRTKPNGEPYFYSEGSMAYPDRLDSPARTMLTSEGSVNRSSHVVEDPLTKKLRTLTPVEAERINGFPDGWTNVEGIPKRFPYFAMGNALVVPVVERIGSAIIKM